jgi:NADH dehydrogenase [ubiquinone] 1 alpha subcomplex assembly factor 1
MNDDNENKKEIYIIDDFNTEIEQNWQVITDEVMGGRSISRFSLYQSGTAIFEGEISLENNGGFASVQNNRTMELSGYNYIKFHSKGDGRTYKFRFWTAGNGNIHDYSYQIEFHTGKDEWKLIEIPFTEFQPFFRGVPVMDVPDFNPSKIRRYGFLIGDKQEGPFRLEIDKIQAIK